MKLRSGAWFQGDDEVALDARVAMAMGGHPVHGSDAPVIGLANSSSDLNPCNQPLDDLVASLRFGIEEVGGVAVQFPVMSLGEDIMKPAAMLYRNLVAMEVEESLRSQPLDGVIVLAACDKSVPAIATVTVLQFIQIWDDLLVGLLFLQNPAERPITVGLAALAAGRTTSIPQLMAGSLVSALPAMIVYLGFQRFLVRGLTLGIDR